MNRCAANGFTLIETVISLVLLSFIALLGYQGLIFGMEQWRKGHDRLEFAYAYQQAIGWVRNTAGVPERIVDHRVSPRNYLFDGKTGSVEFVARFERARRGGLYVTRLYHDRDDNSLKVSYYLHHPDIDPRVADFAPDRVTILPDVAAFTLAYYGKKRGKAAKWHGDWGNTYMFPRLIRLEIETVDGVYYQSIISVLTSNNV
ncbi:MAG: prepilin-type N-terminal cleavage/methylation domain-containing protein [Gammaproteobacteria bacterium]|nr:prepilin-type N-terminal cleavage/methylation domain-containing protein [Gammaproteobacteria bacterium]